MAMIKTDKAHQALRNRASLSVQERQILILCDGIRSRQEIAGWLGDTALALFDSLAAQGYLVLRPAGGQAWTRSDARDALCSGAAAPAARTTASLPAAAAWQDTALVPIEQAAPVAVAATAASKRSLAACKMYAQGILQMQRGSDVQHMLAQLNASPDEAGLVANLQQLLRFLQQKTNASYADKVRQHLGNILPEQHLASLQSVQLLDCA